MYQNAAWVEYLTDRIPVKRPGQADDLDGAVVFLASESSRYVTGQTLLVDGGISTGATKATLSQLNWHISAAEQAGELRSTTPGLSAMSVIMRCAVTI